MLQLTFPLVKKNFMTPLDLVKLTPLMEITSGRPDVTIGVIDGPVAVSNPDLVHENIREGPGKISGRCVQSQSIACAHGTFVAGILCAKVIGGTGDLPGLHFACSPDFFGDDISE